MMMTGMHFEDIGLNCCQVCYLGFPCFKKGTVRGKEEREKYLGKIPGDALVPLFGLFDLALKLAVDEGVALVELEVALVGEEAATSLWNDASDVFGGHQGGGEVDEVLPPRLQRDALLPDHGELGGLADEHLEVVVLLVEAAEGHSVGVEVQGELEAIPDSLLRLHLFRLLVLLHIFDQLPIF